METIVLKNGVNDGASLEYFVTLNFISVTLPLIHEWDIFGTCFCKKRK